MDLSLARRWAERGVEIRAPETVDISAEVRPEQVAPGVVLHAGCRLRGASTSIGPGCVLGSEAPMTVEDCQLGHGVELRGGFASGATFLDGVVVGSAAHIRPGTLMEEQASCAHAVGLKQTVLMPFVTTGSLVNLCDLLIAGGTSRRDHTEVGSSYVHFNFTPHGDKATPSLVGDVPDGVFCDQPRIFLGGQGGLVGPARIAYGVVIPAGVVWRGDALEPYTVVMPPPSAVPSARPFVPGAYRSIRRVVLANLSYIGNLDALAAWYRRIRRPTMTRDPFREACRLGALERLREMRTERLARLEDLAGRMEQSVTLTGTDPRCSVPEGLRQEQERLRREWRCIRGALEAMPEIEPPEVLLRAAEAVSPDAPWPSAAASFPPEARREGAAWLRRHVERCIALWPVTG